MPRTAASPAAPLSSKPGAKVRAREEDDGTLHVPEEDQADQDAAEARMGG